MAKVQGRIIENGQPKTVPPATVVVMFTPIPKDGEKPAGQSFACPVNEDGSFVVFASGGQLPPGEYDVLVEMRAAGNGAKMGFRRELKPGSNDVTLDIAKPGS